MLDDNEILAGGNQREQGWQQLPNGLEPAQQLHAIANAMTEKQKKDYMFITKARDRLRACVPKFRGPALDCWHLWKNKWRTACNSSLHPEADTNGFRFALKEALVDDAAIAAQSVTKDSRILTVEQMLTELDKIFQLKTESAMAQREFKDYLQHPDEPAIMYFSARKAFLDGGNIRDLLEATRAGCQEGVDT
ncbi:MAG: hypothetical protein GY696_40650 [Gammaproteobacteria bacterium]|nr:hypothetical protein [Gammaproteobacteria bacterium]